jgi:hypothetical protein
MGVHKSSRLRAMSSDSSKNKAKAVQTAATQLVDAVGKAMPSKTVLTAAMLAASPYIGPQVGEAYKRLAAMLGAPTNQILSQIQQTVAALAAGTPTSPPATVPDSMLAASSTPTTLAGAPDHVRGMAAASPQATPQAPQATPQARPQFGAGREKTAAKATPQLEYFGDMHRRLSLEPPDKTCGELLFALEQSLPLTQGLTRDMLALSKSLELRVLLLGQPPDKTCGQLVVDLDKCLQLANQLKTISDALHAPPHPKPHS